MIWHYYTLFALCYTAASAYSFKQGDWRYSVSGYIKYESAYDTRQNSGLDANQYLLYPAPVLLDSCGRDSNNRDQHAFFALESRAGVLVEGPALGQYTPKAVVAADFFGRSMNGRTAEDLVNTLTMRYAYIELESPATSFLCGYFWHPFCCDQYTPNTISNNGGDPFFASSRNPQIRIQKKFGRHTILGALVAQTDYASDGPEGFTPAYSKNGMLPNIGVRYEYTFGAHSCAVAVECKRIAPRITTTTGYTTHEALISGGCITALGLRWPEYVQSNVSCVVGKNLTNFVLLGGYAITQVDPVTDKRKYTNCASVSLQCDSELLVWKEHALPGLFFGFAKNLGASKKIIAQEVLPNERHIYGIGSTIDCLWRVAPRIRIFYKSLCLGLEVECTGAAYGELTAKAAVTNTTVVHNVRLLSALYYTF